MNYRYDKIGNLKKDIAEGMDTIRWTVYGKINKIVKGAASTNISYNYDASGNRTVKEITAHDTLTKTLYVRDAQGNVMAVYKKDAANLKWSEQHLYGSSRLGMWQWNNTIPLSAPNADNGSIYDSLNYGSRNYELTNHLGNVLATISDKKIGNAINDTTIDYFNADVVNANDYYPGGMTMPGRKFTQSSSKYRYGFNGKEKDDEVKGEGNQQDYGMRIYDPRLVRFLSVDPITKKYPELTPYQFASNSPISGIDLDGLEYYFAANGHFWGQRTTDSKGNLLDEKTANSVRIASGMTATKEFTIYTGVKDLGIAYKDFEKNASTVYGESSFPYSVSKVDLTKEMFSLASVHKNFPKEAAYGESSAGAIAFRNTPEEKRNDSRMQIAIAGQINALTGGPDYSNGARFWDGKEQSLFSSENDKRRDIFGYKGNKPLYAELHMNTRGWSITDDDYSKWKSNIGSEFKAPQIKYSVIGANKGKITMQSTAVHGRTIFWKETNLTKPK